MNNLSFEEFGIQDNPPLVILHGFLASSRNWRQIAKQLSSRFHVFVPDQRNHGASPHYPVMDYPSMARDLHFFLDETGLDAPVLLGHSMGGKVAMWFALNHPERLARLIVADIAPVAYRHNFNGMLKAMMELPLEKIENRKQAEEILSASIPEQSFRQFLLQNLILENELYQWRIDIEIFYRNASNIIGFPETSGLTPYEGKSLFVAGEYSDYVDESDIRPLFPNAKVSTVAGAGHWLHAEKPVDLVRLVEQFCFEQN
ncbi:MAG: alpha/beta fold hydrolase [Gammaproteobacteria bacterium]